MTVDIRIASISGQKYFTFLQRNRLLVYSRRRMSRFFNYLYYYYVLSRDHLLFLFLFYFF